MIDDERMIRLLTKWTADSDGYRSEAQRLEQIDRTRHATSITMLEARAQALDQCILELRTLQEIVFGIGK